MATRQRYVKSQPRKRFTREDDPVRKAPEGAQPPLAKDSRVHERGGKRMGTITELGPEVSGVTFDDGTFRYINMRYLVNKGRAHVKA